MEEALAICFYSLNKIFFLLREISGSKKDEVAVRRWKICAWTTGLVGLPFVTDILLHERDWIFGWVELATGPAMVLGLVRALTKATWEVPKLVDRAADALIGLGIGYSTRDFGGLFSITQGLELTAVVTFQVGTYLLSAHEDYRGYLWYIGTFAAAGSLLFVQLHYYFAAQQVGSAIVIYLAYRLAHKGASNEDRSG